MKVIFGIVRNIESVKAIVGQLPKLRSQASATALVSLFSESGGMGAAATLGGITGSSGYYIHFYIDDIEFYAAFTGIFFKEGEEVYVVYDEDIEQNFNVLAIMNKNNKLLGMAVPFGQTVIMSDKSHNRTSINMGIAISIFGLIAGLLSGVKDIYIYIYYTMIAFIISLSVGYSVKKQFRGYAEESERIYKILGITDLKDLEKTGMKAYIDENNRMYDDVYNYTQFLSYDPQPLVDVKIDESHLR
ncbi:putative type VI secretion system effector [Acinetobacter suaedae]|nr:putative type VI secretion system effector [Acinetobacter sp. C16S1]